MLSAGLLSVTFRKLSPERIVELALEAGLETIEWGGDIHVKPGDLVTARRIAAEAAPLRCAAYGSYYRAGEAGQPDFKAVMETAQALGAPTIRVWAGMRGSAEADDDYRRAVWRDTARICRLAERESLTVTFEFHSSTLTDTVASLLELRQAADSPAFRSGWQTTVDAGHQQRREELLSVLPFLSTVHAFHWLPGYVRLALADGENEWNDFLQILAGSGADHPVMLEFVRDDSEQQFLEDAATLKRLIAPFRAAPTA